MMGMLRTKRSLSGNGLKSTMVRIVLIRPGATDYTQQGRLQGTLDVPLNDEGAGEVARLADELRTSGIEIVYALPCEPARQTAQAVAGALGVKHKKLDGVPNLDYGLWQGIQIEDVRHKQPRVYRQWQETPEIVCPPEGEMLSEADQRVRAMMARLLKRHREGVIGLVLLEPLMSLVRRFLTGRELGDLWKAAVEHGAWEVLEVDTKAASPSSSS